MATFRPKNFNTYVSRQLPKSVIALLSRGKPPKWAKSLSNKKQEQFDRWRVDGTPFLVGQKKVYLPKFTVTLLRTPNLSPSWAQFEVPLHFNKLDMRDYLFHAYNVTTRAIRSYIPPVRVERRIRLSKPGQRRRYRPKGIKKMTVELEKPFVWPEVPTDWRAWDRERYREALGRPRNDAEERQHKVDKRIQRTRVKSHESVETASRSRLREMAEDLLSGRKKWAKVDPSAITENSQSANLPHR